MFRYWKACRLAEPRFSWWHRLIAGGGLVAVSSAVFAQSPDDEVELAGTIDLARLIDLCADRLGVPIEYDAKALEGTTVTLRLATAVPADRLWALTNQLLPSRGLTTIRAPGDGQAVLSVVRLTDAPAFARVEDSGTPTTRAGYATVRVPVRHRSAELLSKAVKPLLSKVGGVVTIVEAGDFLLISDLTPRVRLAVETVQLLDVPDREIAIEIVPAQHQTGAELAALVTATVTARNALTSAALDGRLTPTQDGRAVVLVAPEPELEQWRRLIAEFDRPAEVETRTIVPRAFALDEVARLFEHTARVRGPRGSGDRWQVVSDPLTGTLIVTAAPAEFERIDAVLARLDEVPPEARRSVRAIRIRNRAIGEVVELLSGMIDAGILEAGSYERRGAGERTDFQRSVRDGATDAPQPSADAPPGLPDRRAASDAALSLTADEGTNTLIAIGRPRAVAQVEELVRQVDVRQPQVMIEALVVNLSEGDTLDLGVELERLEVAGSTMIALSSLFGLGGAGVIGGTAPPAPMGSGFTGAVLSPGDFSALIRALETLNEGRSLNVPKVLVNNNQQALLDSVLQQPFTNVNASDTVATTSFGGFESAGTSVTVTAQIAEGDHLVLEYAVSLSTFVGESSDPSIPPPRQQNNLQSVVTIPDGYTIAVGGLDAEQEAEAISQVPLLGEVPIVGELFRNRSRSSSRSRFYVFIRANIMRRNGFEDLKYVSDRLAGEAGLDADLPEVRPRVIP